MAIEKRICPVCLFSFIPKKVNQVYCCEECSHNARLERDRQRYVNSTRHRKSLPMQQKRLTECSKIANSHRMTYGKAQAAGLFDR